MKFTGNGIYWYGNWGIGVILEEDNMHTPGPWYCDEKHLTADHKLSGPAQQVSSVIQCTCKPNHTFSVCYVPYTDADARLIAAAPDLLEALEEVIRYYEIGMPLTISTIKPFEEAIEKARTT